MITSFAVTFISLSARRPLFQAVGSRPLATPPAAKLGRFVEGDSQADDIGSLFGLFSLPDVSERRRIGFASSCLLSAHLIASFSPPMKLRAFQDVSFAAGFLLRGLRWAFS